MRKERVLKLRNKILLYFGTYTFIYILVFLLILSSVIERSLLYSARRDLRVQIESVYSAAESLIETAISNYLRAVLDLNMSYLEELNAEVESGNLSLERAKQLFQDYVIGQKIGESGYVVAIEEKGDQTILEIHPYLKGEDAGSTEAGKIWLSRKNGYSYYNWRNPGDDSDRKKVAYLRSFEPWNWILGATTFEDELHQLVNIEDLRGILTSFKIKENGYFYLMDSDFIMRIHPNLEGENVWDIQDVDGIFITHKMMENVGSFYYYRWFNPSSGREEEKYALAEILEPFGWYVIASGYVSDILMPIHELIRMGYLLTIVMGISLFLMVLWFSRSLTLPMYKLIEGLRQFYRDHSPYSMQFKSVSEIESVGKAIEKMTSSILNYEKERLKLTEQQGRILNAMPSMLVGLNRNGKIIFLNDKAAQYAGVDETDALDQPFIAIMKGFEEIYPRMREGLESGRVFSMSTVLKNASPSDEKVSFEVTVYPLDSHEGTAVIRMDDVSERTRMEEMLLHSQKMDAIGQMAGGIAHDFNNMLTAILHSLEYLETTTERHSEGEKYLAIIKQASQRAADLTQKLLTFSRKANKVSTLQNMTQILRQTVEILGHSIDKRIRIEEDFEAENSLVQGDAALLQSLFINLGINAAQAMPTGGVLTFRTENNEITAGKTSFDGEPITAGQYLRIEVSDTGTGIPEEIQNRIFEPFFTTKEVGEGTGLGLSSVLGTVKQHGGNITLKSELHEGTVFIIELPVWEEV